MNKFMQYSKRFAKKHSSTILTSVGAVGVVTTSVMAVKATPKAMQLLEKAEEEKGDGLTKMEKVRIAGPVYIPSIAVGASTIACIFGANVLNKKHQAGLMSAYALVDNSYKEYKNKVKEMYGEEAEEEIQTEIAKDKYEGKDVLNVDDGDELFYDHYSGRYFMSTLQKVQQAEYYLNRDLIMQEYATLNDFYRLLDIPEVDGGDNLGWSTASNFECYWQVWIDFSHSDIVLEDGTKCKKIWMMHEPMMDFEDDI